MDIDANLLRWANLTAIQRLARSLGVDTTWTNAETQRAYRKRLIEATAAAIETDKRRFAAEEQRMKDEEERRALAAKIADALGEVGERPRAQIARIVRLMGAEWTRDVAQEASLERSQPFGPRTHRADGSPRTLGGIFFALARLHYGSAALANGTITRREFFRAFTDRPPKPRAQPTKPATKAPVATMESPVEAPPDPYHVMHRTRGGKGPVGRLRSRKAPEPVVEYVATRRRSG